MKVKSLSCIQSYMELSISFILPVFSIFWLLSFTLNTNLELYLEKNVKQHIEMLTNDQVFNDLVFRMFRISLIVCIGTYIETLWFYTFVLHVIKIYLVITNTLLNYTDAFQIIER